MKMKKENAWKERRLKETARKTKIWAEGILDKIVNQAWEKIKANTEEKKKNRLEIAGWKSLTAKVKNWKVTEKYTLPDKKRRKDWQHIDSPSKKPREGKGEEDTTLKLPENVRLREGHSPPAAPTGLETKTDTGGPKKPQVIKKLQVRTRKWVKKKNGLFGWVSCVQAEKGRLQASKASPRTLHSGGVENSENTFKNIDDGNGRSTEDCLKNMALCEK